MQDIIVVAIEQAVAAPLCSARLAEAGARVIKVERPGGDFARAYDTVAAGESTYFAWINQRKESVVLDLKQPEDAAVLERLIASADVVLQNLAPGALERLGFGSASLRERDPRLITCDISGYEEDPAVADMKAYDLLVQAESGLIGISGGPHEIGRIGVSICDIGAGMTAHAGILEALLLRERTGVGSGLKVSLFDVAADWMTVPLLHHDYGGGAPTRVGLHHPSIAPYGGYATADGEVVVIGIQNEREWKRFCGHVLERPGVAVDPRFVSNPDRVAHRPALDEIVLGVTRTLPRGELIARLKNAGIAYGSVNSVADLSRHPALRRRIVHTAQGRELRIPARPVRSTAGEPGPSRSPMLDEHGELRRLPSRPRE